METFGNDKFVFYHIKFTILLVLQIAGIVLTLLIFIFFAKHRALLQAPQNHGLLILLVVNTIQLLFDIPLSLDFYSRGYVNPPTATYCIWWTYFEYTIYAVSEYLLATISVQRHMFIFSQNVLRNRWRRNILHHLPLFLCLTYPTIFYVFAIIVYPCDNTQWDYTSKLCGFANCYLIYGTALGTFDLVVNNGMPVVIDITANIILILRVFAQKRRAQQPLRWRQQRHMMMQLFCLSGLYLIGWTPFLLVEVINVVADPTFLRDVEIDYFADLIYICYLFFPWMCLGFFPELRKWIIEKRCCGQGRNVVGVMQSRNTIGTIQSRNNGGIIQTRNAIGTTQPRNVVGTIQVPHLEMIHT